MKNSLLISLFCLAAISVFGQNINTTHYSFKYRNNICTELFGNGSLYSFIYERIFLNDDKLKTTGQIGFEMLPKSWDDDYVIYGCINELISFQKHHIEFGIGYGYVKEKELEIGRNHGFGFLTGRLGYRFQKPEGRFVTKIAFTPFLVQNSRNVVYFKPWGGISFGYNFGKK